MKKLALALLLCAICLFASPWKSTATSSQTQTQPNCPSGECLTFSVPVVTHGQDNDQFIIPGQNSSFTVVSPFDPGVKLISTEGGNIGGLAGTTARGVSSSTPNSTVRIISCSDSLWDINIVLRTTGRTIGDTVRLFTQNADGSGRTSIATFTVESGGFRVTELNVQLGIGNRALTNFLSVGAFIPLSRENGTQTDLLTLNLPAADMFICKQFGIEITRGSNAGTTSILITDVIVTRTQDRTAVGTGIFNGGTGTFPIGTNYCSRPVCPSCPPEARAGAVFLIIDEDSIDNGNPPNFFSDVDVNDQIAEIGVRSQLRYFERNVGRTINLYTGQVGDEGWFALPRIPEFWNQSGGLRGFLGNPRALRSSPPPHGVGPGLGAPLRGDREALLDKIPQVTPLRARGLELLEGKQVCAVVYDSDVSINYGPLNGSLKGANLGTVAFEVLPNGVNQLFGQSSGSLPQVKVKILDARCVCTGDLRLYTNPPKPPTSSEPYDINPDSTRDDRGYTSSGTAP